MALFLLHEKVSLVCTTFAAGIKPGTKARALPRAKTPTLKIYPQVVSYLLGKYATDESIADADDKIFSFSQHLGRTLADYAEELIGSKFRTDDVYDKQGRNEIFIKGFIKSMRHSMRRY